MSQHPSNNHPNNMNEELFQQNTSTPVQASSTGVDKSIWDMYQYLLQHGSGNSQAINQKVSYGVNAFQTTQQPVIDKSQLFSTSVEQFSSQQVSPTLQQPNTSPLDQLLALNNYIVNNNNGALITPSPFQQQQLNSTTTPHHQQNVSPILVVINNNSHNTSLNHLHNNNTTTSSGSLSSSPTTSNTDSACSPLNNIQLMHAHQQQLQLSNNVPMYFNSSMTSNPSSNFYQYMEEAGQGVENHQVKSTMKQHGIQKTHKMISKLPTSHVSISSIPSQSNNNSNSSSPASSSNHHDPTITNMQHSDSQSESKFSRPLLKNETVLCEKNPKFKQNYFVFEKKKEKTPISFHNISVSEIISGEVSTSSPKVENRINVTKASNSPQPNSSSSSRKKKLNSLLNKESPTGISSISGSSHSQQILSMMIGNNKSTNSILHHRMTHSPNTNDSNHGQQFKIFPNSSSSQPHTVMNPTLIAPSQQCVSSLSPQSTPSNVMNVLLNNGNLPIISNNLNNMLQNNQYVPINTFDTTTSTDALLANLPPVVESLFHQQTNTSNNTVSSTNTSNMTSSTEATPLNSNDDLLFDDFIVQEDLNSLGMSSTSSVFQQQGMNEFTPEQWSDLLQYMINNRK